MWKQLSNSWLIPVNTFHCILPEPTTKDSTSSTELKSLLIFTVIDPKERLDSIITFHIEITWAIIINLYTIVLSFTCYISNISQIHNSNLYLTSLSWQKLQKCLIGVL